VNRTLPKINFIGNKIKIADWICDHFPKKTKSLFDAFSGGCSVSYEAKKRGYQVFSNDIMKINYIIAKSLIENSKETLDSNDIKLIFDGSPKSGFMHKNYSNVYYFENECKELDLYRFNIEKLNNEFKKALALTLMRRAMIRKMPYSRFNILWNKVKQLRDEDYSYKTYKRKRAYHNQSFEFHFKKNLESYNLSIFDNGMKNKAFNHDIYNLSTKINADIIYVDPPYAGTMNNYHSFYSLLDSFVQSREIQPFKNNFTNKKTILSDFEKLFSNFANFKYWIISYNNRSYPNKDDMMSILEKFSSNVKIIEKEHDYKITGKKMKKQNKELLFIVNN